MRHSRLMSLAILGILMSAEPGVAGTGEAPSAPPADGAAAPAAATPAPVAKVERLSAHGVTRPAAGTKTGRVWEISDTLSKAAGKPIARKEVMDMAVAEGINSATIATQYGKWRVYNGLKGVSTTEPKPPKAKKAKATAPADTPTVEGAAAPAATQEAAAPAA